VELYHRPCVILSLDGEQAVGSARSIKGFDLYLALSSCKDLFSRFGGHEQAAGLSILKKDIPEFRRRICDYARSAMEEETLIPHYIYDGPIAPENISPGLLQEIDRLAPFGVGNPTPRFLVPSAIVENSRFIGKEANHIKLALALGQRSWDAVGFGMAESGRDLHQGCRVSLLTSLKRNEWMGVSSTQFQIYSMKRIYRDRRDLEDLLASFYFKFFDVFFTDFLYNGSDMPQGADDACLGDREILSADQAADLLNASMIGTGIFVNTPESAACILEILMKKDMLDRIPVRYHMPDPADGAGRNSVILVPGHREIPERYYHTILLPAVEEGFLRDGFGANIPPDKVRYLITPDGAEEAVQLKEILQRSFTLTRSDLGIIYKWLRRIVPGRDYWPDAGHLLLRFQEGTGRDLNGFQLRMALEIFKELGFIAMESGNQYIRIQCFRDPVNRQLEESGLYVFHRQWLMRHGIKE
jgi:single-stranded-DNA-specific exonuclease